MEGLLNMVAQVGLVIEVRQGHDHDKQQNQRNVLVLWHPMYSVLGFQFGSDPRATVAKLLRLDLEMATFHPDSRFSYQRLRAGGQKYRVQVHGSIDRYVHQGRSVGHAHGEQDSKLSLPAGLDVGTTGREGVSLKTFERD